eukprot:gnl/TRDRNA2_/TRDRNA2_63862_c0_seq1.p1 gnl/TRDRNA2_/TRDRNA2_63862_c0~~gnl/TRDRNA2_/TRDRNA2_63862_c0_seq1.p1  ORF type:complete len:357 (+),score=49.36 gnl/TRDRNA2_/TRDRNA2_63862_c0_seq1:60-1130(+)
MLSFIVSCLLAYAAQARGAPPAAKHASDAEDVVSKALAKLVHKLDETDNTTLASGSPFSLLRTKIMNMQSRLNKAAENHPRGAAFCSAIVLSTLGDATAQHMEQRGRPSAEGIDMRRAFAMGSYKSIEASQFFVPFFDFLGRKFGEDSVKAVVAKTAATNFVAIPVCLPAFYAWTSVVSGHNYTFASERFRQNIGETFRSAWLLWVPADLLIFGVVPPHLRVPAGEAIEYLWCTLASLISNRPLEGAAEPAPQAKARRLHSLDLDDAELTRTQESHLFQEQLEHAMTICSAEMNGIADIDAAVFAKAEEAAEVRQDVNIRPLVLLAGSFASCGIIFTVLRFRRGTATMSGDGLLAV